MYPILQRIWRISLFLSGLCLVACDGDSQKDSPPAAIVRDETAPTAVLSPSTGALNRTAPIVVRFSESMNPGSLRLDGILATQASVIWSTTTNPNDTLTLSPSSGEWRGNDAATLSLAANDLAGNPLATVQASYTIPLVFNNFQAASTVIGHADFTTHVSNIAANTLRTTQGSAVSSDGKLFIADKGNNRVLVFNQLPTTNNANADLVLGQPDFISSASATTQDRMAAPRQIAVSGNTLIVADTGNRRVLIYNPLPTALGALPNVVVGQPDFVSSNANCDRVSFNQSPYGVAVTPEIPATLTTPMIPAKLIVTDTSRVLIWNSIPTTNGQPADLVLGQGDFTHCTRNDEDQDNNPDPTPSQKTLYISQGTVWTDGTRLVVADDGNNRILIWNTFPTQNFQPADLVLGQSDFIHRTDNDDNQDGVADPTPSARVMRSHDGLRVSSDGTRLAAADSNNHRVLIWTSFPTQNFQAADLVLGQSDFQSRIQNADPNNLVSNNPNPSEWGMRYPHGVLFYRNQILVSDSQNNRVLIFESQ